MRHADERNVLMLTLGTGLGVAVICEGQLVRGEGGVAGHLGHITVDPDGPPCVCGSNGCLETFFCAKAIEGEAMAAVHQGLESQMSAQFHDDHQALTCEAVFRFAKRGDLVAKGIIDRSVRYLGAGLAGLVHAFDPEIVILGGQISQAGRRTLRAGTKRSAPPNGTPSDPQGADRSSKGKRSLRGDRCGRACCCAGRCRGTRNTVRGIS